MSKKALVTGACGFVGPYVIKDLLHAGYDVTATHVVAPKQKIDGAFYERLDIVNFEECSKIISRIKPDVIFHLAGIAFVPEAENNFDRTLQINVAGVNNLIRIPFLLERPVTFVFISSAEVYGKIESQQLPLAESAPIRPQTNYSLSKSYAEQLVLKYADRGNGLINPIIVRPFNHIGAGQDPRFVASSFAKQLADIKRGLIPAVMSVGNLDAERDFSDVQDIARGYRLAAEKGIGVYNLCSGVPIKIETLLHTLIKIADVKVTIEQDAARMRPAEVPTIYGSYNKAKLELGWKPTIPLEDTLRGLFEYWMDAD